MEVDLDRLGFSLPHIKVAVQRLLAPLFKKFPLAVVFVVLLSTVKFCQVNLPKHRLDDLLPLSEEYPPVEKWPKTRFRIVLVFCFPTDSRQSPAQTNCSTELRNIIIRKIKIMQKMKNNSERRWNDAEISLLRQLIGNLAWLAQSSRPSLALCAARLQQHIFRTTVKDVTTASRLVDQAKEARQGHRARRTPSLEHPGHVDGWRVIFHECGRCSDSSRFGCIANRTRCFSFALLTCLPESQKLTATN